MTQDHCPLSRSLAVRRHRQRLLAPLLRLQLTHQSSALNHVIMTSPRRHDVAGDVVTCAAIMTITLLLLLLLGRML